MDDILLCIRFPQASWFLGGGGAQAVLLEYDESRKRVDLLTATDWLLVVM